MTDEPQSRIESARQHAADGELDAALDLLQQERDAQEARGDQRAVAAVLGEMSRVRFAQDKVDLAQGLQQRRLEINREQNDLDGIAAALWDLAQMDLHQDRHDLALPRLEEAWSLFGRTGRIEGLAAVGTVYGQLLASKGELDTAREILAAAKHGWTTLGQDEYARKIDILLAKLSQSDWDPREEAPAHPSEESPQDRLQQAIAAAERGKVDHAISELNVLVQEGITSGSPGQEASARGFRAQILGRLGRFEEALRDVQRGLQIAQQLEQEDAEAHFRSLLELITKQLPDN